MASIQQGRVNNGFQTLVKLFRFQSASSVSNNSWTRHPRQPLHYGDTDTRRKAFEGGAEALLTKPIAFVALRSEIDSRVAGAGAEVR